MSMDRDIKKEILIALLTAEQLRYGDIHPHGVDNDLFNYHLQHLVKKGLVEKIDKNYRLTGLGKYEVAEQNPLGPNGKSADQFKLNVLTVVLRQVNGQYEMLMQKRKRHPFYGTVSVMGGTVEKGELVADAAKRKLLEETGLSADFKLCGLMRQVHLDSQGVLVLEDILFHICCTDSFSGELNEHPVYGDNYWCSLDQAIIDHRAHQGTFQLLGDFLSMIRTTDFRVLPLFYWERKKIIDKF
ncbi:NUDIX domain-containing protein [Candidatus Gracilibacteria bacterium]|nr:NUDIX domain-containing protein [Candidatus Gracilibacteria bacterium]